MYIDNENFDKWMERLSKSSPKLGSFNTSTESTSALFQNFLSMNDKQQTGLRTGKGFAEPSVIKGGD